MRILDAFATFCVSDPDEAYAMTYRLKDAQVLLYLASSLGKAISGAIRDHLELLCNKMHALATHLNSPAADEDRDSSTFLGQIRSSFIAAVYAFAWRALYHRFSSIADTAIRLLDEKLSLAADRSCDTTPVLNARERSFFANVVRSLKSLQNNIHETSDANFLSLHEELYMLHGILTVQDAPQLPDHFDTTTTSTLSQDIRSLTWLTSSVDVLLCFAHSPESHDVWRHNSHRHHRTDHRVSFSRARQRRTRDRCSCRIHRSPNLDR